MDGVPVPAPGAINLKSLAAVAELNFLLRRGSGQQLGQQSANFG
jgi:hypothetical protein